MMRTARTGSLAAVSIQVRNPRTGGYDYAFDPPDEGALDALVARLRAAQPSWQDAGPERRAETMMAWRGAIEAARERITDALVRDTGRLTESSLEVNVVTAGLERWAKLGPELLLEEPARAATIPTVQVSQGMRPYPLVGVISPWNFPLLLATIDAIPALAAGCAVIVKPSEVAPRFIEAIAPTIPDELPLAFIAGDGNTGRALIDRVDLVCFTGSVETGRLVAAHAAARFIPAFLELGGKDPAVVLASADIQRASSAILWGGTANAGQSCQSIERVYVARAIHDAFVELLVEKARAVTLAVPEPSDGMLGPIIALDQVAIIGDHLADARDKGATIHCGGALEEHGGGTYLRPTVLTGVDHSMRVMTDETFGPLLPVMPFDEVGEAVRLANATRYGLSAAVFGDPDEALAVGRRIDAGGISINDAALTALVHDGEKNSFKASGLGGSRMGPAALRRFGRRQAYLSADPSAPDPWWYPHLR
jgi:acyl-CoA reductase-like NAD-dependent aldehyde dehydrogenase